MTEEEARSRLTLASCIELGEELLKALKGTLPDEFWQHRRAAQREALMAARVLLDAAIERLEAEPESAKTRPKAGRIEIE
jgi:hypothetical protein